MKRLLILILLGFSCVSQAKSVMRCEGDKAVVFDKERATIDYEGRVFENAYQRTLSGMVIIAGTDDLGYEGELLFSKVKGVGAWSFNISESEEMTPPEAKSRKTILSIDCTPQ
ncbi:MULTISPECIES: hypothetical protein [Enterobacterales]|jgi:hypothetical protein|uniref:hypothetical protein n=1 Tax=Enterobacterales TaxID=91347 RepID=UPI0008A4B7E7|nr:MULTISPECIES: hypothetical protein [Enterobacterales]HEE0119754.1 hypothetical protein [Citrobacter gillenii]MEB0326938.1 hypothetical protein [Citrobacter portucalensis]MEB0359221.1 hypothetical protein [Citrobacter portucalensis]MEB0404541.1 hypothetical protein [Citrobacter portucalensis]OFS08025.1 hypothetical protein HMPREF3091_20405 [Hafnia sp. HMSC23F03]